MMIRKTLAVMMLALAAMGQASQPAEVIQMAGVLSKMPAAMAPKAGETARQAGERQEWLSDSVKGKRVVVSFKVGAKDPRPSMKDKISGGIAKDISVTFTLADARIYKDDTATVEGTVTSVESFPRGVQGNLITLADVKVVSVVKAK